VNNIKTYSLSFTAALLLSACSTLSNVGDTVSGLNPFGGNNSQGELTDDPDRISILELSEKLVVTGELQPSDVVLPDPVLQNDWTQVGGNTSHSLQRVLVHLQRAEF